MLFKNELPRDRPTIRNIVRRRTFVHWSAGVRRLVLPIIEVRVWDWPNEKDKKVLSFVGKTNANIILTFSRATSKDRYKRVERLTFLNSLLSKAAQGGPPRTKPTPLLPPFMKDPCPASYSFVGRDPRAFFFSQEVILRINQPTNP